MPFITGEAIRQFRTSVNLTQQELADKLEYSRETINRMEHAKRALAASIQNHLSLYAEKCGRVPELNGDVVTGYVKR